MLTVCWRFKRKKNYDSVDGMPRQRYSWRWWHVEQSCRCFAKEISPRVFSSNRFFFHPTTICSGIGAYSSIASQFPLLWVCRTKRIISFFLFWFYSKTNAARDIYVFRLFFVDRLFFSAQNSKHFFFFIVWFVLTREWWWSVEKTKKKILQFCIERIQTQFEIYLGERWV